MVDLIEQDKSWIAGFIDGEGCINFNSYSEFNLQVRVMISNANLEVLEWIKFIYGGYIHRKKGHEGWKQNYQYVVSSRKAMKLLKDVGKYLRIKQKQYKIALDYEKTVNLSKKHKIITINNITKRDKITGQIIYNKVKFIPNPKILQIRQQLKQQLKELNHRGTA
jgi:hypothetical protein